MNRRGFSLVELLIVLSILGILANLVLPAVAHMRRKAEAVHVIADFSAIRVAALDRYVADGGFPPLDSYANVPAKLAGGLPKGFDFQYGKLEYRWMTFTWTVDGKQHVVAGVGIRGSNDPKLMAAVRAAYRGPIIFLSSTELIFMIE